MNTQHTPAQFTGNTTIVYASGPKKGEEVRVGDVLDFGAQFSCWRQNVEVLRMSNGKIYVKPQGYTEAISVSPDFFSDTTNRLATK